MNQIKYVLLIIKMHLSKLNEDLHGRFLACGSHYSHYTMTSRQMPAFLSWKINGTWFKSKPRVIKSDLSVSKVLHVMSGFQVKGLVPAPMGMFLSIDSCLLKLREWLAAHTGCGCNYPSPGCPACGCTKGVFLSSSTVKQLNGFILQTISQRGWLY
jgi:hypothetical protein